MFLSNEVGESKCFNRANIHRIRRNPKIASLSYKQFRLEGKTNSFPKLSQLDSSQISHVWFVSSWNNHIHNQVMGFPHSSVNKEPAYNAGDPGSIPGLGSPLEKG